MSDVSDLSSILQNSLLLSNLSETKTKNQFEQLRDVLGQVKQNPLEQLQEKLRNIPSVLDKNTIAKLREEDNEFGISLKEYTSFSTYNTMMSTLYGNTSASRFQNTLNLITNSPENELASAKTFVEKMKENGMSNSTAVRTYSALKQYSILSSSLGDYSFVNAKA